MGIALSSSFSPQTPLGEACSRMDLTAIHEILEEMGYKDDEGIANEVLCFSKIAQLGFSLVMYSIISDINLMYS